MNQDDYEMLKWVEKTYFPVRGSDDYRAAVEAGVERFHEYGDFIVDDMGDNCGDDLAEEAFSRFIKDYPSVMAFDDEYNRYLEAFEIAGSNFQRQVEGNVKEIVNKGKIKENKMKKVIKINENDIRKMVMESLSEIGWQIPNDLYDKHRSGAHYLDMFAHDLNNFVEKWTEEETDRFAANNINRLEEPIRGQVLKFIELARKMSAWCERKAEQIEGFEQTSKDKFQQQHGMGMEDYANQYGDESDSLFSKYINGDMSSDEYHGAEDDLKSRYPEIDNITRY